MNLLSIQRKNAPTSSYETTKFSMIGSDASAQEVIEKRLHEVVAAGLPPYGNSTRGPTRTSSWVIPGVLLWGDAPKPNTIATLIDGAEDGTAPPIKAFLDLRAQPFDYVSPLCQPDVHYTAFDISTQLVSSDGRTHQHVSMALKSFTALCLQLSVSGSAGYFHCDGGHFPSAIAAAAIVSFVYGVSGLKATTVTGLIHECRLDDGGVNPVFSAIQKATLRDLARDQQPVALAVVRQTPPQSSTGSLSASQSLDCSVSIPRPGSRFANTKGSGGGANQINLFASTRHGESASEVTPARMHKRGRAAVAGMSPGVIAEARYIDPYVTPTPPQDESENAQHTQHQHPSQHLIAGLRRRSTVSESDETPWSASQTLTESTELHHASSHTGTTTILHRDTPNTPWALAIRPVITNISSHSALQSESVIETVNGEHVASLSDADLENITRGSCQLVLTLSAIPDRVVPTRAHVEPPQPPVVTDNSKADVAVLHQFILPPILVPSREQTLIQGPTSTSNWVVRDSVLAGPLPDPRNKRTFSALVAERFDAFICLLADEEAPAQYLPPYRHMSGNESVSALVVPLEDGAPLSRLNTPAFLGAVQEAIKLIRQKKKLYIHCLKGHGRTGMFVACLLHLLYGIPSMRALNLCDALHKCRTDYEDRSSPETQEQRLSVISVLKAENFSQ